MVSAMAWQIIEKFRLYASASAVESTKQTSIKIAGAVVLFKKYKFVRCFGPRLSSCPCLATSAATPVARVLCVRYRHSVPIGSYVSW